MTEKEREALMREMRDWFSVETLEELPTGQKIDFIAGWFAAMAFVKGTK